jgi:DNA-binding NtrC family response regulator
MGGRQLSGKRIVVVENDRTVKSSVEAALSDAGALIALSFDRNIDAAILDVRIGNGVTSIPIAIVLEQRNVPFLFYTAHEGSVGVALRARWPDCTILSKPLAEDVLIAAVAQILHSPKKPLRRSSQSEVYQQATSLLRMVLHHSLTTEACAPTGVPPPRRPRNGALEKLLEKRVHPLTR